RALERAHARGECADRRHELPGNARLELDRTKRGARQHARVSDREAERRRQLGVALDAAALVPHERGYAHGLLRELERLTEARRELVEAARTNERATDSIGVTCLQRGGDILQHCGELGEDGSG